jgi:hypothetical protein
MEETMMTTTSAQTLGPTEEGAKEAEIFDLIKKGASDVEIVGMTHVPIRLVKALRAELAPRPLAAPGAPAFLQERADRRRCECSAFQSEHERGEGKCLRTLCVGFQAEGEGE